jgi:hypothetical protein
MPSASCGISNVNRWAPDVTSVPTRPSRRPSTTMPTACRSEPCARTTDATRPSTMSEKYSAGPNRSAIAARGGPKAAIRKVATVPAKNEPTADVVRATPARPCRAIW